MPWARRENPPTAGAYGYSEHNLERLYLRLRAPIILRLDSRLTETSLGARLLWLEREYDWGFQNQ